jgi:hypothetical protein
MTLNYIQLPHAETNTLYYQLLNGQIKTRPNNPHYIHKKPNGLIKGTNLTLVDLFHIQDLIASGAKIQTICQQFNISYYYFRKALKLLGVE